jgi:hypothetical protein
MTMIWERKPIPGTIYNLTHRQTFEFWCRFCPGGERVVIVDQIAMLDRFGYERPKARMICKVCGQEMRHTRGWMVDWLQKHGKLHKLTMVEGCDLLRSVFLKHEHF